VWDTTPPFVVVFNVKKDAQENVRLDFSRRSQWTEDIMNFANSVPTARYSERWRPNQKIDVCGVAPSGVNKGLVGKQVIEEDPVRKKALGK